MIPLKTASGHPVTHIVFSADGSMLAVAQPHFGVTILERATGRTVAVCAIPRRASFTSLTFFGDDKFLAISHAKGIEAFDARTGTRTARHHDWYRSYLLLAAQGDLVFGAKPGMYPSIHVAMRAEGGACVLDVITRHSPKCSLLAISPRASTALGFKDGRYALLCANSGRVVAEIASNEPHSLQPRRATICPLGKRFAINEGSMIDVYDTSAIAEEDEGEQQADTPLVQRANGPQTQVAVAPMPHSLLEPVFTLKPSNGTIGEWYPPFALLADGRGLLVKRPRNRIQMWDAPTGTLVNEWSWRFEWVTCVAVCADNLTAVAGGRFGRVLIWDLE